MKRVLIIGCGFVGVPLGAALAEQGHEVYGIRRSASAGPQLSAAGIRPLTADLTDPESLARLPRNWDWVVNCAAASGGGEAEYRRVYLEGARTLIRWLATSLPQRYVYTGSTGVYGQDDGSLVDETSPTTPEAGTARILVETEQTLLAAARDREFPAILLRLSGIYGRGRGYWLSQFLSGDARLERNGDRILNMIHCDDIVGSIIAALERGRPRAIYNVTDDEPVAQRDLFKWLAQRLGKPMPPASSEAASVRRRAATNKAVSNRRLRAELGVQLKYPTFREGFEAVITSGA